MLNLIPKIGIDGIGFDCHGDEVLSVYGEPTEMHIEDDKEVFEYLKQGLAFFFDHESKQLNEIEIERVEVAVWGVQMMFTSIEDVSQAVSEHTDAEVTTMQHDEITYLFIEDIGLAFSFEDNALVTISAEV
jgi:hypothetical protein